MSLLDYVPGVRYLEAAAFAVVVTFVGGVYVKQRVEVAHAHRDLAASVAQAASVAAARARDVALAQGVAQAASAANAIETTRRESAQKEIANETQRLETRARDAAVSAAAADADRRLRDAFARSATAGGGGPAGRAAPAGGTATGTAPDVVQADVFGGLDDTAGELAKALDVAHARGLGAQRAYDALTASPSASTVE